MPFADPERRRSYQRDRARLRRAGRADAPAKVALPDPIRIQTARDILAVLAELYAIAGKLAAIEAVEHAARVLFTAAADEAEYEAFRITNTEQPTVRRTVRRERGHLRRMLRHLRRALVSDGAAVARAFA